MHPVLDTADADRLGARSVELLRELLRFDTTNPPGDERACADHLAEAWRNVGLEPRLLEAAPGRVNVVARLAATDPDPSAGPLLLNGHLDVVPADAERWTHPPFAGEVHDGWIWGRGAVDMKHMLAMSTAAAELLAASDAPRRRDLILAAVADEEAGCDLGSGWLVDHHPDLVRAEHALGEVGGFPMMIAGARIYPVQVAEKGICWVRARAHGVSGHGSMPRADNAVVALAAFLERVGTSRLRLRRSAAVEEFVRALADAVGPPANRVLPLLLRPGVASVVLDRLVRDEATRRTLDAVLRNTASPTGVRGGAKTNVIPAHAEAEIDGRIAVGSSAQELLAELRRLAGPAVELEVVKSHPPTSASSDTPLFATIREVVAEHDPGAVAIPSVIPGFTDASRWSRLGTICYGFSPVVLPADGGPAFSELFHADDERVPVAGVHAGARMLADVVLRHCTVSG